MSSLVSRPPAADSARALKHFESLLEFETDCWDVHHAIVNNRKDFVLLGQPEISMGAPNPGKAGIALAIIQGMIFQMITDLVSVTGASLLASLMMVLTG